MGAHSTANEVETGTTTACKAAPIDNFRGLELARFEGDPSLQQLLWSGASPALAVQSSSRNCPSIDTSNPSTVSQGYRSSPTSAAAGPNSLSSDSQSSSEAITTSGEGAGVWRSNSAPLSFLSSVPEEGGAEDDGLSLPGFKIPRAKTAPRLNSRGVAPRLDTSGIYTRSVHLPFHHPSLPAQSHPGHNAGGVTTNGGNGASLLPSPSAPGYVWLQSHNASTGRQEHQKSGLLHYQHSQLYHPYYSSESESSDIYDSHASYEILSSSGSDAMVTAAQHASGTLSEAEASYHQSLTSQWSAYNYDHAAAYWSSHYHPSQYPHMEHVAPSGYEAAAYQHLQVSRHPWRQDSAQSASGASPLDGNAGVGGGIRVLAGDGYLMGHARSASPEAEIAENEDRA
ncbi:hypothetical protein HDU67_000307 [Dinochytrium kinnereticum]|nr:hypothetical protein HDU67_000307 [Dinochytrium kinnereticum]